MFFKKKHNHRMVLECTNSWGIVVSQLEVQELKIREEYILQISKTEYDNDEPCIIIRTSIMGDIFNRFQQFLVNIQSTRDSIRIEELPDEFKLCIDWGDEIKQIKILNR